MMENLGSRSGSGSLSTVSKEENMVLSSEASSSAYTDEAEVELGLGLSLGVGGGGAKVKPAPRAQYARILTAKDLPCVDSTKSSSSSSSSSKTKTKNNLSCGTKRAADSASPPRSGVSQVVGWPPIRAYRMNSLINQSKSSIAEEFTSTFAKGESKNEVADNGNRALNGKGFAKTSLFVKVNMDGIPIGRKVDLSAQSSYEALAKTLDDMFYTPSSTITTTKGLELKEQGVTKGGTDPSRLLDESSDFVLTYEDKEGDWMLVGDVPWEMFLNSVKRLRIMRTSEANGLGPRCQQRSGRQRTKPI